MNFDFTVTDNVKNNDTSESNNCLMECCSLVAKATCSVSLDAWE